MTDFVSIFVQAFLTLDFLHGMGPDIVKADVLRDSKTLILFRSSFYPHRQKYYASCKVKVI